MNTIDIAYVDNDTKNAVKALRSNIKLFTRINEALNLIGDFDKQVVAEIFNEDKRKGRTDICITDNNEDLFILTARSLNKNDLSIIRKVSDKDDKSYDVSLVKKAEINKDNIELCRTSNVYGTRHGRLISDGKTFFSFFLGGNNAYQLLADFSEPVNVDKIIGLINRCEDKPKFVDFIGIFQNVLSDSEIDNIIEITSYTEFCQDSKVRVKNEEKGKQKKL